MTRPIGQAASGGQVSEASADEALQGLHVVRPLVSAGNFATIGEPSSAPQLVICDQTHVMQGMRRRSLSSNTEPVVGIPTICGPGQQRRRRASTLHEHCSARLARDIGETAIGRFFVAPAR
jgi:hypothetical protein